MNITIDQMIEALTEMKLKEKSETPKSDVEVAGMLNCLCGYVRGSWCYVVKRENAMLVLV